jgi:hypothetical protein
LPRNKKYADVALRCIHCLRLFTVPAYRINGRLAERGLIPLYCSENCDIESSRHHWNRKHLISFLLDHRFIDETTGCWLWIEPRSGKVTKWNYPCVSVDGFPWRVSKVSLWVFKGDKRVRTRGRSSQACHTCDNPKCFNPDHLFRGNPRANALDSVNKRRHWHTRKTHCSQGHPYDLTNTGYLNKEKTRRRCLACHRERERERNRNKAVAA